VSTRRVLHLHLGLRFGYSCDEDSCSRVEGFLREIERLETKKPVPLYWNCPVVPLLEKQNQAAANLVAAIRRRIESRQDQIVPSGFFGMPHPQLLPEELQHELLWCYRNPWFPALKNLFDMNPEHILPVHPDLFSEAAENAYSRHGFRTIGIPTPLYRLFPCTGNRKRADLKPLSHSRYTIRGSDSEVNLVPIAVLRPEEVTPEGIDTLLSCKADALYMVFDLTEGTSGGDSGEPAAVERLFGMLSRHRRLEFLPFSAGTQKSVAVPIDPAQLLSFAAPVAKCSESRIWDQIENLRKKKRKSNLQMRDLLKFIGETLPSGPTARPGRVKKDDEPKLEITNISMAGAVTLIGVGLQATFSEGRLSNLIDHGKKVLPGEPGRSFFTIDARRELLQTDSAFSFDREGQTGLRSMLSSRTSKDRETVQVVLDYYFADDQNRLILDIMVRYPSLSRKIVTESAPLELCLCSFTEDDHPMIEVEVPNRDPYRESVAPGPGVFVLWGKRFSLQQGNRSVELQVAPLQKTRVEQIEFRIEKKRFVPRGSKAAGRPHPLLKPQGSTYLLWTNLGGSYLPQPAADLSARRLNLSYGIRFSGAAGSGKRS
jgi:hypothetical protein